MEEARRIEECIAKQNQSFSRHTRVQQEMIIRRTALTERLANIRRTLKESLLSKGGLALQLTGKRRTVSPSLSTRMTRSYLSSFVIQLRHFKKKLRELKERHSSRSHPPLSSNVESQPLTRGSSQSSIAKRPLESESSEEEMAQEQVSTPTLPTVEIYG